MDIKRKETTKARYGLRIKVIATALVTIVSLVSAMPVFADDLPNHFIVLFDASGSMKRAHSPSFNYWQGRSGDNSFMAERISDLVNKTLNDPPQGFPRVRGSDRVSVTLFNLDTGAPSYDPQQMFLINSDLLLYQGLPPPSAYWTLDYSARTGQRGAIKEIKDALEGYSPLVAATTASLPFLARSFVDQGLSREDRVGRIIIVRITDGRYATDANVSDEYAAILRQAGSNKAPRGFDSHRLLSQAVNKILEIGAARTDCAVVTHRNTPKAQEAMDIRAQSFECNDQSFAKVLEEGMGFMVSYLEVKPRQTSIDALVGVSDQTLDLLPEYRDGHIHLVASHRVFATPLMLAGGLAELRPTAVSWRYKGQSHWQSCILNAAPGAAEQGPHCHGVAPAGTGEFIDLVLLPDGNIPSGIEYRFDYEMHFVGRPLIYPFVLWLSPATREVILRYSESSPFEFYPTPRDPRSVSLNWLNPLTAFRSMPLDPQPISVTTELLKIKAAEWAGDPEIAGVSAVTPALISRVSKRLHTAFKTTQEGNIVRARYLWTVGPGLVSILTVLAFVFWPHRRLVTECVELAKDGLLLDFNNREHERISLVGLVRVINAAPSARTAPFKKITLRLEQFGFSRREGDAAAIGKRLTAILDSREGAPLAIGSPGQASLTNSSAVSGQEYPLYFNPTELKDFDLEIMAQEQHLVVPVAVHIDAGKAGRAQEMFQISFLARPEMGRIEVTATGIGQRDGWGEVAQEFRKGERAIPLCIYRLQNTACHRYSLPVNGELRVLVFEMNNTRLDNVVHLAASSDGKPTDLIRYHSAYGDILDIQVIADFSRIDNPFQEDIYRVVIERREGLLEDLNSWQTEDEWRLRVQRSSQRTDCSLQVIESEFHVSPVLNQDQPDLPRAFEIGADERRAVRSNKLQSHNKTKLLDVRLVNACRDGHGYAKWTATLEPQAAVGMLLGEAGASIRLTDNRGNIINAGCLLDSHIENERMVLLSVEIDLNQVVIQNQDMGLKLLLKVTWDVYEDGDNDRENCKTFINRLMIKCRLRHEPPRDVLAIDFGTSALAIAHATGPRTVKLLQLQRRLKTLQEERGVLCRLDDREGHSPFLSSECNVELRSDKLRTLRPDNPDFLSLPLIEQAVEKEPEKVFSSLKAMISAGFRLLPLDAGRFPYTNSAGNEEHSASPPLDEVILGAYRNLLRDYIDPILSEGNQGYSHIYITHPNTYTPNHVQQLRRIVEIAFKGYRRGHNVVYPNNIRFFSESDAVAFYYMVHAREAHGGNWDAIPNHERILVYDIGAGTLDLTHLEIQWEANPAGGKSPKRVKVLRRGGVTKAGDLLDECIARDLHAYLEQVLDTKRYINPIVVPAVGVRMDASTRILMDNLRTQIHALKIRLSDNESDLRIDLTPEGIDRGLVFTALDETPEHYRDCDKLTATVQGHVYWSPHRDQVLLGSFVRAFLTQVTQTEVRSFFGGAIPTLDTVILSGRTSLLPGFEDHLRETLGDVPHWENFSRHAEELKCAVVLGVIEREFRWNDLRFEEPDIIGEFGVLYEHGGPNLWQFRRYTESGATERFHLYGASEIHIGLKTNNGFHACFQLLPSNYMGDDKLLDIQLDFDKTGFLCAQVRNNRSETELFTEITNIATLGYTDRPWPLGVSMLAHRTPEELVGNTIEEQAL